MHIVGTVPDTGALSRDTVQDTLLMQYVATCGLVRDRV
jgi:hypothetical protein